MFWTTTRWVLVLPAAILALLLVFAIAKIFTSIGLVLATLQFGPESDIFDIIFCGFAGGYAYVFAGLTTAPTAKKYVAVALASLPALYSITQIIFCFVNFFVQYGRMEFSTVLENFSLAGGAVTAALERYRQETLSKSGLAFSSRRPVVSSTIDEDGAEGPPIDYDALVRRVDDEEEGSAC